MKLYERKVAKLWLKVVRLIPKLRELGYVVEIYDADKNFERIRISTSDSAFDNFFFVYKVQSINPSVLMRHRRSDCEKVAKVLGIKVPATFHSKYQQHWEQCRDTL